MFSAWSTGPMIGIELIIESSFKIIIITTFIVTLTRESMILTLFGLSSTLLDLV